LPRRGGENVTPERDGDAPRRDDLALRFGAEPFGDADRTRILGVDQRDETARTHLAQCPVADGERRLGREAVAPGGPLEGPAELDLRVLAKLASCSVAPDNGMPRQQADPSDNRVVGAANHDEAAKAVVAPAAQHPVDLRDGVRERAGLAGTDV